MKLTRQQLIDGLKYEEILKGKLKKEFKRIEELLINSENTIKKYHRELDLFAVSGSLPSLDDATKVAVKISEEAITPPLDVKEQAMFIAGFQECIKWLNVIFGNDR